MQLTVAKSSAWITNAAVGWLMARMAPRRRR